MAREMTQNILKADDHLRYLLYDAAREDVLEKQLNHVHDSALSRSGGSSNAHTLREEKESAFA